MIQVDSQKKITVCMTTYNGEKYLKSQIESILNQLPADSELIINDDQSTDNTLNIIKQFNDSRIDLEVNINNLGYILNFSRCIGRSTGEIVFLADQDDIWEPTRVSDVIKLFDKYDLVINDCTLINEKGETILESFYQQMNSGLQV